MVAGMFLALNEAQANDLQKSQCIDKPMDMAWLAIVDGSNGNMGDPIASPQGFDEQFRFGFITIADQFDMF